MRLIAWIVVALTGFLMAGSASALVTINHTASTDISQALSIGSTFVVQVRVSWDGQGALDGIFASTATGNANVLVAESAVSGANMFRGSIFAFTDNQTGESRRLSRVDQNQLRQAGDGLNVVRSVQYESLSALFPAGAASNVLVTTITFRMVGAGTTTIGTFLAPNDTGARGDQLVTGAAIYAGCLCVIPRRRYPSPAPPC